MPTKLDAIKATLIHNGKPLQISYCDETMTISGVDSPMCMGFISTLFGAMGQLESMPIKFSTPLAPVPIATEDAPPTVPQSETIAPTPARRKREPKVIEAPREVAVLHYGEPDVDEGDVPTPDESVPGVIIDGGPQAPIEAPQVEALAPTVPALTLVPPPSKVATPLFVLEQAAKDLDGVTYMSKIVIYLMEHGIRSKFGMLDALKALRPHHKALAKLTDDAMLAERINRACTGLLGVED